MNQPKLIKSAIVILLLIIVAGGCYYWGWRSALNGLTIKTATPTQIAQAMKNDNFYSTYNENTLRVHGVVSSISQKGRDVVVGLSANSSFQALCNLGAVTTNLQKGNTVTVLAEAATAERQTQAVMLINCTEL
jgi:hypothetical protein